MGDVNQLIYLKTHLPELQGSILEVGSKDYGNTQNFRDVYPSNPYVGIDMASGKNVDKVLDVSTGTGDLEVGSFALIICCSVLEHVPRPWEMAEHLNSLLAPGGTLYMSVPWVWRYHAYPDDYFRFSWRGIESLFPQLSWREHSYSTTLSNEIFPLFPDNTDLDNRMAVMKQVERGSRKYLPYLMVNMLGTKPA